MNRDLMVDFCQRLRGLRAAQKNVHYAFETYGQHIITDRFAEGEENGFNCNDYIDQIQECVNMYFGESIDEIEIDSYLEEYSLSLEKIKDLKSSFATLEKLFRDLVDLIQYNISEMSAGEQNLFGNMAQEAMRAAAFYKRLGGKNEGNDTGSQGLAEDDA